jgi:hypothetical protein
VCYVVEYSAPAIYVDVSLTIKLTDTVILVIGRLD